MSIIPITIALMLQKICTDLIDNIFELVNDIVVDEKKY